MKKDLSLTRKQRKFVEKISAAYWHRSLIARPINWLNKSPENHWIRLSVEIDNREKKIKWKSDDKRIELKNWVEYNCERDNW